MKWEWGSGGSNFQLCSDSIRNTYLQPILRQTRTSGRGESVRFVLHVRDLVNHFCETHSEQGRPCFSTSASSDMSQFLMTFILQVNHSLELIRYN